MSRKTHLNVYQVRGTTRPSGNLNRNPSTFPDGRKIYTTVYSISHHNTSCYFGRSVIGIRGVRSQRPSPMALPKALQCTLSNDRHKLKHLPSSLSHIFVFEMTSIIKCAPDAESFAPAPFRWLKYELFRPTHDRSPYAQPYHRVLHCSVPSLRQ